MFEGHEDKPSEVGIHKSERVRSRVREVDGPD